MLSRMRDASFLTESLRNRTLYAEKVVRDARQSVGLPNRPFTAAIADTTFNSYATPLQEGIILTDPAVRDTIAADATGTSPTPPPTPPTPPSPAFFIIGGRAKNDEGFFISGSSRAIEISRDGGNTWTNAVDNGTFSNANYVCRSITGLAYNGSNLFVASSRDDVGAVAYKHLLYSTDGSNWSNATSGYGYESFDVKYLNGKFYAVGAYDGSTSETIQYSTDGMNWNRITSGGFDNHGFTIEYGNGVYVASGDTNTNFNKYSIDGVTFSNAVVEGGDQTPFTGIKYANNMWVASRYLYGERIGSIMHSTDGINWFKNASGGFDRLISGAPYHTGIAYGNGKWVVAGKDLGGNSNIQYSIDGINWSNAFVSNFDQCRSIIYDGTKFIAVGYNNNASYMVQTSVDGITWVPTSGTHKLGEAYAVCSV